MNICDGKLLIRDKYFQVHLPVVQNQICLHAIGTTIKSFLHMLLHGPNIDRARDPHIASSKIVICIAQNHPA